MAANDCVNGIVVFISDLGVVSFSLFSFK